MKSMLRRTTLREIRGSLGRFLAIFGIIALGVGFFCGVKSTTPAMVRTMNDFIKENQLFDFRLVSTIGWEAEDVERFRSLDGIRAISGANSLDAIFICGDKDSEADGNDAEKDIEAGAGTDVVENENPNEGADKNELVFKCHTLLDNINKLRLLKGRMPASDNECVVDARMNHRPQIGDKIRVSGENKEDTKDGFAYEEYEVVGFVDSVYYFNFERGSTSIGNGSVDGFMYIPQGGINMDVFTEIFVKLDSDLEIYSDEYKEMIEKASSMWESRAKEIADERYDRIMDQVNEQFSHAVQLLLAEYIQIPDSPEVFVFDRNTNIAYSCFESDSKIVGQVARVFPVFFMLVAALVCMTTMSRMVEEQRMQIGTLKALGYSDARIMGKFIFYSGSAAFLGAVLGYIAGILIIPGVIWVTYSLMYITLKLKIAVEIKLALGSLLIALLCSVGVTYVSCRTALFSEAATLMRPKAPKTGKRVLLERVKFIWNRMKFLNKVSYRNIFRYKRRLVMMLLGVSGCTALLMTGFGLNDSIAGFAKMQFDEIQVADSSVIYNNGKKDEIPASLKEKLAELNCDYIVVNESSWDLNTGDKVKGVSVVTPLTYDGLDRFMKLHDDEDGTPFTEPGLNEILISSSISSRYELEKGDKVKLINEDLKEIDATVAGVFENHVYNFVFMSAATLNAAYKDKADFNALYLNYPEDADVHKLSSDISSDENVTYITINEDFKNRITKMMDSLKLVVLVIIVCAAGLFFIVLYNLTNINITERLREIATVKVLGFYDRETNRYVLKENLVLTAAGALLGLLLGIWLHRFVMSNIVVDMVHFRVYIAPVSFGLSLLMTLVFNFLVNLVMKRMIFNINMAESLKSVE